MAVAALPLRRVQSEAEVYRHRYLIAFAVTLASVLELVDTSIVNVAIPHMMGNLGATLEEVAWVSTGYIVANVIILPLTSWLEMRLNTPLTDRDIRRPGDPTPPDTMADIIDLRERLQLRREGGAG